VGIDGNLVVKAKFWWRIQAPSSQKDDLPRRKALILAENVLYDLLTRQGPSRSPWGAYFFGRVGNAVEEREFARELWQEKKHVRP
jgi:hypothetical protein